MFKELLADILVAIRINSQYLVLEGKQFGPMAFKVSAVVSFRNMSNGYYGGSMGRVDLSQDKIQQIPLVKESVTEVSTDKEDE